MEVAEVPYEPLLPLLHSMNNLLQGLLGSVDLLLVGEAACQVIVLISEFAVGQLGVCFFDFLAKQTILTAQLDVALLALYESRVFATNERYHRF